MGDPPSLITTTVAPLIRHNGRALRNGAGVSTTFAALKTRNYRYYWLGLVCYVLGHRAEYVTFAWMVWEVTHEPIYLGYLGLVWEVTREPIYQIGRASCRERV